MVPPAALLLETTDTLAATRPLFEAATARAGVRPVVAAVKRRQVPALPVCSGEDDPGLPVAAVLGPGVRHAVAVGRHVHAALPSVPIWFLVGPEKHEALLRELGPVPLLGDDWAAIDPGELSERLASAAQAALQRRAVRARYDDLNRMRRTGSRARAALHSAMVASEHRLALVLEHAHEAIVATDGEGRILAWNAATELLFECDGPDHRGQRLGTLLGGAGGETLEAALATALRGRTAREVVVAVRPDEERELEVTVAPLFDEAGRIDGASVVARDVTARRAAAMAIRQALERERAARAEAERASRAKDEFLWLLSHELRTPLHTMMLSLGVLEESPLDPADTQLALGVIRRSVDLQARLVQDLLNTTRILAGRIHIEPRPLRVRTLVEQAVAAAAGAAREKGISIGLHTTGRLGRISADPDRLAQVLANLLGNAIKFSARGSHVDVDVGRRGGTVTIVVRDRGEGMTAAVLEHVFERFWTGDSSSTRHHGGIGLGLSITKHLVEAHGGTITAESAGPGAGATFTVRLPAEPPTGLAPA